MKDSSYLSTNEEPRSISIELYPRPTNNEVVQLALDAVKTFFETHKTTDLNNAIELVEQLVIIDERNLVALNGLRDLAEILTMDSGGVKRDDPTAEGHDAKDHLDLWRLHWIAGDEERNTAEIISDLLSNYEAERGPDHLERAIGLAESLALSCKENEKALSHLVKLRLRGNHSLKSRKKMGRRGTTPETTAGNGAAEAVQSKDHKLDPESMTNLEKARFLEVFYKRFVDIDDVAYLENAIPLVKTLMASTRLRQMDPSYVQILLQMVDAIASRLGVYKLLGKAVEWVEAAMKEIPAGHPDGAALLDILGYRLSEKYAISGEVEDLEQAIKRAEESVEATSLDDPERAGRLSNLGSHLFMRYEYLGVAKDLERAIEHAEEAVAATPAGHANRSALLNNLGTHLSTRYIISGSVEDLERAVKCAKDGLETATPEDPDRATLLSNLSDRLFTRYEMSGAEEELREAIKLTEEALVVAATDQEAFLSSLASQLWTRYRISGVVADLEQAIRLAEEVLATTPPGHRARITRLSNLGVFLSERYKRLGATEDLQNAIRRTEEILEAAPPSHALRATSLNNLGCFLSYRYKRLGAVDDLEQAIKRAEQAVAATPLNHTDRPARLNNLGTHLSTRDAISGSIGDLEKAIKWTEESISTSTSLQYHDRAVLLHNLGNRLFARYERSGLVEDLEQAIQRAEEATAAVPPDHMDQGIILVSLASHLNARYEQTDSPHDFHYILRTLYSAWHCHISPPLQRVIAARRLFSLLALRKMWQESSSLLADAVKLLPKVTSRSIDSSDKEYRLSQSELVSLASNAVSLALQAGEDASVCLRLLELGRGVIIGLIINCRNDESDLREKHPGIYEKFINLRAEIDSPLVRPDSGADDSDAIYKQARDRRKLVADELDQTLASIKELPGFEGFQLPPHADSLMAMADEGPIVVFNTTVIRSDAIIVTCSVIKTLRLEHLVFEEARAKMREMRTLIRGKRSTYVSRNRRMDELLQWLWDVAVQPVCEALQLSPVPDTHLPHIWWIGVGPLATPGKGWQPLAKSTHEATMIVRHVEGKARATTRDRPSAA